MAETNQDQDIKRWKQMQFDETTGKYIVSLTERTSEVFSNIEDAVAFMKKSGITPLIQKEAGSHENSGVQRGQTEIEGLKEVKTKDKLIKTPEDKWKVETTVRSDMIYPNESAAKTAFNEIENAKEVAKEDESAIEVEEAESKKASLHTISNELDFKTSLEIALGKSDISVTTSSLPDIIYFNKGNAINGFIDLGIRKLFLSARDAKNFKYDKSIDFNTPEDAVGHIEHFYKDITETYGKEASATVPFSMELPNFNKEAPADEYLKDTGYAVDSNFGPAMADYPEAESKTQTD